MIADNIQDCITRLKSTGVVDRLNASGRKILPDSLNDFAALYNNDRSKPHLQKAIWKQIQKDDYDALIKKMPVEDQVRLKSCTTAYSGLWLTTMPRDGAHTLEDQVMRTVLCLRLNACPLPMQREAGPIRCPYASSHRRVCQDVDLRFKWDHGISCHYENNRGRKKMHEDVLDSVLGGAKDMANLYARRVNANDILYTVDAKTGKKLDNKQPDGVIDFDELGELTVIDVRGVCPTSESNIKVNSGPGGHQMSANMAADKKDTKYKLIANNRNMDFIPFVFNTCGGLHGSAQKIVAKMMTRLKAREPDKDKIKAARYGLLSRICVAIMRNNHAIVSRSLQRSW